MTTQISILPVALQPHLALDLVRHFAAEILALDSSPNFYEGIASNNAPIADRIYLYPFYLEDKPDNAGVVRVVDKEPGNESPLRTAGVTVTFRMPKDGVAGASGLSGQKRALAAAEALLHWLRPHKGLIRTEVDSTLPSGRAIKRWSKASITSVGEDGMGRFMATVSFEILYADINN